MRKLALVLAVACGPSQPQVAVPTTAVTTTAVASDAAVAAPPRSEPPKLRLPRTFTPASYTARLAIDPAKQAFDGTITIAGALHERSAVIWLHGRDLSVVRATARGVVLTVAARGIDLLELHAEPALEPGELAIEIAYTGKLDDISTTGAFRERAGERNYVYTQFEALYARRVFPCLDEPDSKVPWQLTIDVPAGNQALSNTPVAAETALPDGGTSFAFARTMPLPSYLVAFGIGAFDFVPAGTTKSGVPVRIVVPKGRAREADYAAKHAVGIVETLEAWFGTKYPYPKLDFMTIPITTGFGAMENAGLITMTERLALLDAKPSWDRRLAFLRVGAHETAHQWFGDLVTTAWWNDVWLNEGFAKWMEQKVVASLEPAWHVEGVELDTHARAMRADELVTARRIRQPIEVQNDILNVFDRITYEKGASVLAMFETFVGRDVFQRGVRDYIAARAGGNATSTDFVAAISKAAGKELGPAFATFLDQGGLAELDMACDRGKLALEQHRFVPPGSPPPPATTPWQFPVCVAYDDRGHRGEKCTLLDAPTGSLVLGGACPAWIMPNATARGYYAMHLTSAQLTALRDRAWPLLSWAERRAVFHDAVLAARTPRTGSTPVPLDLVLSLVPKLLAGDRFAIGDVRMFVDDIDPLVPDELRGKFEAWNRSAFGPAAHKLGIVPKGSDDLDAELTRASLYLGAAWFGREPKLVAQSVALAAKWRELPDAIRADVLRVAVDANAELFARVLAEVKTEQSRDRRRDMFAALAAVRDPSRYMQALALVLDPAIDIRESYAIVLKISTEATRALAEKFLRDRETELAERMPKDETANAFVDTAALFTRACSATTRDGVVDYLVHHLAARPGGERIVRNAVERLDQCIAARSTFDAELRAWLK